MRGWGGGETEAGQGVGCRGLAKPLNSMAEM